MKECLLKQLHAKIAKRKEEIALLMSVLQVLFSFAAELDAAPYFQTDLRTNVLSIAIIALDCLIFSSACYQKTRRHPPPSLKISVLVLQLAVFVLVLVKMDFALHHALDTYDPKAMLQNLVSYIVYYQMFFTFWLAMQSYAVKAFLMLLPVCALAIACNRYYSFWFFIIIIMALLLQLTIANQLKVRSDPAPSTQKAKRHSGPNKYDATRVGEKSLGESQFPAQLPVTKNLHKSSEHPKIMQYSSDLARASTSKKNLHASSTPQNNLHIPMQHIKMSHINFCCSQEAS